MVSQVIRSNDFICFSHISIRSLILDKKKARRIVVMVVYVDNTIHTCDDEEEILHTKTYLQDCFCTKNLGTLRYFFGISV